MKKTLLVIVVLLVGGCSDGEDLEGVYDRPYTAPTVTQTSIEPPKTNAERLKEEEKRLKEIAGIKKGLIAPRQITKEERKIVGAYECRKENNQTSRAELLDNGGGILWTTTKNMWSDDYRAITVPVYWKVKDGKVYAKLVDDENKNVIEMLFVFQIIPNGSGILIAVGVGELTVVPKEEQLTFKRIKSVKELTPEEQKALRDTIVGTYELKEDGETYRIELLENGACEGYENDVKQEEKGKWIISKEDEVYIESDEGVLIFRINPDGSITGIAGIDKDEKRQDIPKEGQSTLIKIK